jgi:hypothetical protein
MKKHAPILPFLILMLVFGGCSKPDQAVSAKNDIDYYTCTMHPWVHSKKPGNCPVCGMDLVPVLKSKSQPNQAGQLPGTSPAPRALAESHDFDVPVERQQQFGVTYAEAKRQRIVRHVRTVGLVTEEKARKWIYVPRTEGYVQKLYVTSPGQVVEKGQDLLQVYSPDLATSEQELIRIVESRDHTGVGAAHEIDQLIQSAKRRLRQWKQWAPGFMGYCIPHSMPFRTSPTFKLLSTLIGTVDHQILLKTRSPTPSRLVSFLLRKSNLSAANPCLANRLSTSSSKMARTFIGLDRGFSNT